MESGLIVPLKHDAGVVAGTMDFDQAAAAFGLTRQDFGDTLAKAMLKFQRACKKHWTANGLYNSRRKAEQDPNRPQRERNYLPEAEARAVMQEIVNHYGEQADTSADVEEEALRQRLAALEASRASRARAREPPQ